jgi:hypothetical protein
MKVVALKTYRKRRPGMRTYPETIGTKIGLSLNDNQTKLLKNIEKRRKQ